MNTHILFANYIVEVGRASRAAEVHDTSRYTTSLDRAAGILEKLRHVGRPELYEEALLLLRGLAHARTQKVLGAFSLSLDSLIAPLAPLA